MNIKDIKRNISVNIRSFKMCFLELPLFSVLYIIICLVHSLSFSLNIFMYEYFFTTIGKLNIGSITLDYAIILCLGYGLFLVFNRFVNMYGNLFETILTNKAIGKVYQKLNMKISKVDLIYFDNELNLQEIKKATEGVDTCVQMFTNIIEIMFFYIPYIVVILIYLFKLNGTLIYIILFLTIPEIIFQYLKISCFKSLSDNQGVFTREIEYYSKYMNNKRYVIETRFLGMIGYFKKLLSNSINKLNKEILKANKKAFLIQICGSIFTVTGYGISISILINLVMSQEINTAQFIAILGSLTMIYYFFSEFMIYGIGEITKKIGYVDNLIRFFDLPEVNRTVNSVDDIEEIILKNVTFTYPNTEVPSIKNVNLTIKRGQTVAVVGKNGCGKTTLSKLLLGLYMPSKGEVCINNISTNDVWFERKSAVFQDYQRYKVTLKENINISNMENSLNDNRTKRILDSMTISGLNITDTTFPKGLDTMLATEYGGIDLSGGQWQRIAIARGIYKPHSFIVLDEPTSSIDPINENILLNTFFKISKEKTSVIVTHRLGCAKLADVIIVLDEGEIKEIGTHMELMKKQGLYYRMYEEQAKLYK